MDSLNNSEHTSHDRSRFPPASGGKHSDSNGFITTDVDDFTDFPRFKESLKTTRLTTIDSALTSAANILVYILFFVLGFVLPPITAFVRFLRRAGHRDRSAVAGDEPDIYDTYATNLNGRWSDIVRALTRNFGAEPKFDFDLAEFFLQLSSLAYEPNEIMNQVLDREWPPHLRHVRFGCNGCIILALWSVKDNFVVFAFKGTSPYNLTEWLEDFTLRKRAAKNGVLPGLVHSGFYGSFGFPEDDFAQSIKAADNPTCSHDGSNSWNNLLLPTFRKIRKEFPDKKPHLWITGHSLGAALATVFTSTILWRDSQIGSNYPVPNMDWGQEFVRHGTYTFGNPYTGDHDWKSAIETVTKVKVGPGYNYFRVINSNDIVCYVPLATFAKSFIFTPTKEDSDKYQSITLNDFRHLGTPILLRYRSKFWDKRERTIPVALENQFRELLSAPSELLLSNNTYTAKFFVLLNVLTWGVFGYLRDHFPSEYLANLRKARTSVKRDRTEFGSKHYQ